MPFVVKAHVDDLMLTANAGTAKEAFAKAVEWHVAKGFRGVSISDGRKRFTVAEFSWTMASQEIANTVDAAVLRRQSVSQVTTRYPTYRQ